MKINIIVRRGKKDSSTFKKTWDIFPAVGDILVCRLEPTHEMPVTMIVEERYIYEDLSEPGGLTFGLACRET